MAQDSWIERMMHRRGLAHWAAEADRAGTTEIARLKTLRRRAWALRTHLDRLIAQTEARLRPTSSIARPLGTDWVWRPGMFTELQRSGLMTCDRDSICQDATLFHDCRQGDLGVKQIRNRDTASETPFALQLDVYDFHGTFLSLAIDTPEEAVQGLRRKHLVSLNLEVEAERPTRIFARLNIRHGPNTEQLMAEVGDGTVEFDLAYSKMNEARAEKMWLDLIFEDPRMNRIVLKDLTMIRRPRAEI